LADARILADRGDLERARRVAETVLSANRSDVATLELLGSVNLGLGRVGEAREWFRKAIYLDPNHEEALLQLAFICDQMGYPHQANRYRLRAARAHRNTVVSKPSNDEQQT
jgi:chemotaxis protein methyltransferase WspC